MITDFLFVVLAFKFDTRIRIQIVYNYKEFVHCFFVCCGNAVVMSVALIETEFIGIRCYMAFDLVHV